MNPDELIQGLHYYPFMVSLAICNGSFNTPDNPSSSICILSKTEYTNIYAFNMIDKNNESKTL